MALNALISRPKMSFGVSLAIAVVAAWFFRASASADSTSKTSVPPQAVVVDPLTFNVIGGSPTLTFRQSAFTEFFNPTNTTAPFFQVFDPSFLSILGPSASIRAVASNPGFAFAHEAPVHVPDTDDIWFASNDGGPLGFSGLDANNQVSKISLKDVDTAAAASGSTTSALNVTVTPIALPETVQMTNGGTGLFHGKVILVNSGRGDRQPSIALVDPKTHNTTIILDNFFGRQFNSLNDVKIHRQTGKLYFTDVTYGFLNHFRPDPLLPNHVYLFDPTTGSVRVVADGFDKPNGIALSQDGKTAYVTDTGSSGGFLGMNQTRPATIYQFDVDVKTGHFSNRRTFAYVDTGIADGIQLDTKGNVYSGCGDGVHVWNPAGTLIGKFFLNQLSANLVFAGKAPSSSGKAQNRLVILAETAVFVAHIDAEGFELGLP